MTRKTSLFFCLLLMQITIYAKPSYARSEGVVDALSGRYSSHFKNGDMQRNVYWSDDVAEIVPVGSTAAYIRVELNFYNDHTCSISGIGQVEGERISYTSSEASLPGDPPCVLSVSLRGSDLFVDDGEGSCKMYCGARGSLTSKTLPFASRRPISYIQRLKASPQYIKALEVWQSAQEK